MRLARYVKKLMAPCLIIAMCVTAGIPQEPDCESRARHPTTELGKIFSLGHSVNSMNNPYEVWHGNSRYLRIRLNIKNISACNWFITLRDAEYRVVQTISKEEFCDEKGKCHDGSMWTHRVSRVADVSGVRAFVDVQHCEGTSSPSVKVEEYVAMPEKTDNPFYSTQDVIAKWAFLQAPEVQNKVKTWGDYVGFIMSSWNRKFWSCSGVVVAPDLFLTNWHCGAPKGAKLENYWHQFVRDDVIIDLSWDGDTVSRDYIVTSIVNQSRDLDYALLQMKPISMSGKARAIPVNLAPLKKDDQKPLWIIHHPLAEKKRVSSCVVVDPEVAGWLPGSGNSDFTHQCDTEGGSSGAPVLNNDGELVGLHHRGFDLDKNCNPLLRKLNKAVRIKPIIDHLCGDEKSRPFAERILGRTCPDDTKSQGER